MDTLAPDLEEVNALVGSITLPNRTDEEWNRNAFSGSAPISNWREKGVAQVSRRVWPYCGLLEDPESQLSALSAATAIVFHRYTGQETIAILQQLANTGGPDPEPTYRIRKVTFDKTSTFAEVSTQVNQGEENNNAFFTKSFLKNGAQFSRNQLPYLFRFGVTTEEIRDEYLDFEIWLTLVPKGLHELGIRLCLDFKTELYLETQMERLLSHVAHILENGTSHPDHPAETLSILCKAEFKTVTVGFNGINPPDPDALGDDRSLLAVFCENVEKRGSNLAFVQDTGSEILTLTYERLHSAAVQLSLSFQEREVQLGIRSTFVATFLPQGLPFISTSLAALILNKTAAMCHPTYPSKQLESCLSTLGNPLLVTTRKMVERIGLSYPRTYFVDEQEGNEHPDQDAGEFENYIYEEDESGQSLGVAPGRNRNPICLFTSGSTGPPKAVLLTEMAILNTAKFCAKTYGFDSTHRAMCIASTGFVISSCDVWAMFYVGGSIHVPPENVRLDLASLIPWIYDHDITNFYASTAIVDAMLHMSPPGDLNLSKLKWILFAGEKMHRIVTKGRRFRTSQLYGSTETFMATAVLIPRESDCVPPPAGHSLTNVAVYVLDLHHNPVPIGVKGNVYVSGAGVMTGYVNRRPEDIFIANPFKPGTVMYPMGDIGYWTSRGELFIVGRKDAQVKIHGMRLNLGEVEAALQSFPQVQQAIVVLREIGAAKQVIGFCRLVKDAEEPELIQVYQFLESRLQRHAIPCQINFVEDFPRTPSGKIERKALLGIQRKMSVGIIPPLGHHLPWIRKVWAEVIGIPETLVTRSANFFFLGGNSMIAYNMFKILSQEFPSLKLTHVYDFPRFDKFVEIVTSPETASFEADVVNFEEEIKLDPKTVEMISATRAGGVANGEKMARKNILLTGVTGYLGPTLLAELLKSTTDQIICLIRAKTDHDAGARLVKNLDAQNLTSTFTKSGWMDRVRALAGDLNVAQFGLDQSRYDTLCGMVHSVYHSAAEVNFIKTYAQLRETTVAMTRNVIEFAATSQLKKIHYTSTVAVFDGVKLGKGSKVFRAEEKKLATADSQPGRMSNGYNQSKWVGEQLIWEAARAGLPVAIYRIGEIGCHAETGTVNKDDALAGFLLSCKNLGKYPEVTFAIPYISLDKAARGVVALAGAVEPIPADPKVFHMIGKEVSFAEFFRGKDEEECEAVSLGSFEEDFLAIAAGETNSSTLEAWLMLNLIKNSEGVRDRGFLMKNITFVTRDTEKELGKMGMSLWEDGDASDYARILFEN